MSLLSNAHLHAVQESLPSLAQRFGFSKESAERAKAISQSLGLKKWLSLAVANRIIGLSQAHELAHFGDYMCEDVLSRKVSYMIALEAAQIHLTYDISWQEALAAIARYPNRRERREALKNEHIPRLPRKKPKSKIGRKTKYKKLHTALAPWPDMPFIGYRPGDLYEKGHRLPGSYESGKKR